MVASRNGGATLTRTLEALAAQTVQPAESVGVDIASGDDTGERMRDSSLTTVVRMRGRASYGQAIAIGVTELPEPEDGDWLWLLAHDAEPAPDALHHLAATAEASSRAGIIAPKVMRAGEPRTINEFGQTMTKFGNAVRYAAGELDQGQYDRRSDVLGVAETGLLIRRDVFEQLGGFDPALTTVDAGLDLGVRARLAGHQVTLQPRARVRRDGGPELFASRSVSDAVLTALRRRAQLHRRFAYAGVLALILHWLLALPQALVRSIGHLFAKRPASAVSEFTAAFTSMVAFGAIVRSRRRIAAAKRAGWGELRSLRMDWRTLHARRRLVGDDVVENAADADERVGFVAGGALWVLGLALVVGAVVNLPLLTSTAVTGGGLLPLGDISTLWQAALYGDRDGIGSLVGPADPFAIVTAVLGSITFWQPSIAIVALLALAPALSVVTAWIFVRSITRVAWAPAVAAAIWALSPTLITSLHDGRLGAVIAHMLLPLVGYGLVRAGQEWRAAALGALALTAVAAGAPSLVPALALALVVGAVWFAIRARFGGTVRALTMLVPAAALFAPLVWAQRERPLALLADPGIPLGYPAPDPLVLAAGYPDAALGTLSTLLEQLELAGTMWPMLGSLILAAPLVLAAFAAVFLRSLGGLAAVATALAGFATAVAATRIAVLVSGQDSVAVWTGPGLSLMLLGLVVGASITLDVLDFRGAVLGGVLAVFATLTGIALIVGAAVAGPILREAPERSLPALVVAAAEQDREVGTLVIEPLGSDSVRVTVARGSGVVLGDIQTLRTTAQGADEDRTAIGQYTVDLVSGSAIDVVEPLASRGIGFIVLADARGEAVTLYESMRRSLDQRGELSAVGMTDVGLLWTTDAPGSYDRPVEPWAGTLLSAQLLVLLATLLLALPSLRRGARRRVRRAPDARKDFA